jgi:hypothetical protein
MGVNKKRPTKKDQHFSGRDIVPNGVKHGG